MIDVLIIGGGIAGLSAAARLAPHVSVTLLEAERHMGFHSSSRSAAAYLPGYGTPGVSAMITASRAHFEAEGLLKPRGFMLLARPGEEAALEREIAAEGHQPISCEDAIARVPILRPETLAAAALQPDVFDLDADALLQAEARSARAAGAKIVTDARIEALSWDGSHWQVTTPRGAWQARRVINAAGAWADGLAQMAGLRPKGITPHRRSVARLPAPGGHDVTDWPFIEGIGERWYAKPDAGAWLVSPAEQDPIAPMDAWADDMVLAEGLARYEEMVTEPVTRMLANWAGLRSFVPDRDFVLGPDPDNPAFVWCAGQGGNGLQTAPAASKLLADLVLDRPTELPADLVATQSPARFA
jgi:glycine/D-amino acid oxidase-like deaminating enzyme